MQQYNAGSKSMNEVGSVSSFRTTTDSRPKGNSNSEELVKCPRCDSLNTKFCYYNNYSLSQPRHFCKNCRRYWTKGGTLRNVPVGGGCRKNKKVKQRIVDPGTFVPLEETTSNMLASISCGNCSPLLPAFPSFSNLAFVNSSHQHDRFDLTFPGRSEETLSSKPDSQILTTYSGVNGRSTGRSQSPTWLLNSSSIQPSLTTKLPFFDTNIWSVDYPSHVVKPEQGILYSGSDLRSIFETPAQTAGAPTTLTSSDQDEFCTYKIQSRKSFNGPTVGSQLKLHHEKNVALHLAQEEPNIGDQQVLVPASEDDISRQSFRLVEGKPSLLSPGPERLISDCWQGMSEITGELNFWTSAGGWLNLDISTTDSAVETVQ